MATLETLVIEVDGDVSGATSALSNLESRASSASGSASSSLERISEGFDTTDTRAMGFADTIGGVTDSLNALTDPTLSTSERLMALGMGVSDLASGFVNFLIPVVGQYLGVAAKWIASTTASTIAMGRQAAGAVASRAAMLAGAVATGVVTAAQWAWNAAMSANPIGLIILGIAALIAAIVWLVNNWDTVKKAGAAAWNWIKDAWKGAGDFFSRIWEALPYAAKYAFNKVAGWWNNSIGQIGFTVPSWVPLVGGRSFSVPDIPYLAHGGIVTGPTQAMIGEGGNDEAVIPLPNGWKNGMFGGGGSEVTIHLDGDEDLVRLFRRGIRDRGGNVQTVLGT